MIIGKVRKKAQKLRRLLQEDVPGPRPGTNVEADVVPLDSIHAARLLFFDRLITKTSDVPGDIVECGVGAGISMLLMAHVVHVRQLDKQLWGFDSFEGFPEPTPEDDSHRAAIQGELSTPKQQALALLRAHLNDELFFRSKVSLIKGVFRGFTKHPQWPDLPAQPGLRSLSVVQGLFGDAVPKRCHQEGSLLSTSTTARVTCGRALRRRSMSSSRTNKWSLKKTRCTASSTW
jgi:hypothetical protein